MVGSSSLRASSMKRRMFAVCRRAGPGDQIGSVMTRHVPNRGLHGVDRH
jgi:hypothetical protein